MSSRPCRVLPHGPSPAVSQRCGTTPAGCAAMLRHKAGCATTLYQEVPRAIHIRLQCSVTYGSAICNFEDVIFARHVQDLQHLRRSTRPHPVGSTGLLSQNVFSMNSRTSTTPVLTRAEVSTIDCSVLSVMIVGGTAATPCPTTSPTCRRYLRYIQAAPKMR